MEGDFRRPVAPIGGRVPVWLAVAILWGAGFVLALLSFAGGPVLTLLLLPAAIVVIVLGVYFWRRYGVSRLVFGPLVTRDRINLGDPEDQPRLADSEERSAHRRLRMGTISRVEYEKIIAYRRFVHGEITRAQYRAIMAQLAEGEPKGLQW